MPIPQQVQVPQEPTQRPVVPIPQRVQAGALPQQADGPSYSRVGYDTCMGVTGRKHWRIGDYQQAPVATAPADVEKFLEETQMEGRSPLDEVNAHRDGYATSSSRGPRFRHLPAPEEPRYMSRYGAGQPVLATRLDTNNDLRLIPPDTDGAFALIASPKGDLDPAMVTNLVPYPYVKAIRPEQRLRAVSVNTENHSIPRALERKGFMNVVEAVDVDGPYDSKANATLTELRNMCIGRHLPTFGTREELRERVIINDSLSTDRAAKIRWMTKALKAAGVEVPQGFFERMGNKLKQVFFAMLPDEYLKWECEIRGIPYDDREHGVIQIQEFGMQFRKNAACHNPDSVRWAKRHRL